ncbi:hypothetical protein AGLY_008613 [Aphis glycines]|uniref:Uncharacterized protein n=1 Tax=Aphis glycines TaxID=307491 RepID=A0A6G0TMS4_APHGL|nr:hypothetical protein AGLY_008613 [Aphis glycines]
MFTSSLKLKQIRYSEFKNLILLSFFFNDIFKRNVNYYDNIEPDDFKHFSLEINTHNKNRVHLIDRKKSIIINMYKRKRVVSDGKVNIFNALKRSKFLINIRRVNHYTNCFTPHYRFPIISIDFRELLMIFYDFQGFLFLQNDCIKIYYKVINIEQNHSIVCIVMSNCLEMRFVQTCNNWITVSIYLWSKSTLWTSLLEIICITDDGSLFGFKNQQNPEHQGTVPN